MSKYTNEKDIPLQLAVWLATDNYPHDQRTNLISVTSLIKSTRQIILSGRLTGDSSKPTDISTLLASRLGQSLHSSIEDSWTDGYAEALSDLGYPKRAIESISVNPLKGEETDINIYLEKRTEKEIMGFILSGQFDMVFDGRVNDFKSTSIFQYTSQASNWKYVLQGSMYKWLNQDLIIDDHMAIQYIFKDWNKNMALNNKAYPQLNVMEQVLPLMSVMDTEMWIKNKLSQLIKYADAPEDELPLCDDRDLWRNGGSVWKYYAKLDAKRATKNFDTAPAAFAHMASKKNVGIVKEVKPSPTGCLYCNASSICSQYKKFVSEGVLS